MALHPLLGSWSSQWVSGPGCQHLKRIFLGVFSQMVHRRRYLIVQRGCTYFSLCLIGRWWVLFMKQFFMAQINKSSVGRQLFSHIIERSIDPSRLKEVIMVGGWEWARRASSMWYWMRSCHIASALKDCRAKPCCWQQGAVDLPRGVLLDLPGGVRWAVLIPVSATSTENKSNLCRQWWKRSIWAKLCL